jgi:hypothetical protein
MKVVVLDKFADKFDFRKKYEKGQIVEFDDDIAKDLIARKLVKKYETSEKPNPVKHTQVNKQESVKKQKKDELSGSNT